MSYVRVRHFLDFRSYVGLAPFAANRTSNRDTIENPGKCSARAPRCVPWRRRFRHLCRGSADRRQFAHGAGILPRGVLSVGSHPRGTLLQIYLPIAEVSIDLTLLIALGGGVGVLSGLFGVGGGFLITPLLILIGIPPAVAVATGANQVAGASFSGVLVHWRRRTGAGSDDENDDKDLLAERPGYVAAGTWMRRITHDSS